METHTLAIACSECQYIGPRLMRHYGYKWYYFLIVFTGVGILPLVIGLIILGNLTYPSCPACGNKKGLVPAAGPPSLNSQAIYDRARDEDEAMFNRNKNIMACIVFTITIIVLVTVYIVYYR